MTDDRSTILRTVAAPCKNAALTPEQYADDAYTRLSRFDVSLQALKTALERSLNGTTESERRAERAVAARRGYALQGAVTELLGILQATAAASEADALAEEAAVL